MLESGNIDSIASKVGGSVTRSRHSITLSVGPEQAREACKLLVTEHPEFYHLSTITGVDEGSTISIFYHFWQGREFVSVRTAVPKDNPVVPSVSDIFPASLLYESEIKDILGVVFRGNSMMDRRLLLADNYPPEAPPPLRKEADPEKIRKMMQLE